MAWLAWRVAAGPVGRRPPRDSAHIAMRAADAVRAGMGRDDARHNTQRRFGNSTMMKEEVNEILKARRSSTFKGSRRAFSLCVSAYCAGILACGRAAHLGFRDWREHGDSSA